MAGSAEFLGGECKIVPREGMSLATFVLRVRDLQSVRLALAAEVPSVELASVGDSQIGYAVVFRKGNERWVLPVPEEHLAQIRETQRLINTLPTFVKDETGAVMGLEPYVTDLSHDWSGKYVRALVAFERGELGEAAELLEGISREDPDSFPHVHVLLGRVRLKQGELAAARAALDSAVAAARATDGSLVRGAAPALKELADELERAGASGASDLTDELARALTPVAGGAPESGARTAEATSSGATGRWTTLAVIGVLAGLAVVVALNVTVSPPDGPPVAAPSTPSATESAAPPATGAPTARIAPLESLTQEAAARVKALAELPPPSGARDPYRGYIRRIPKAGGEVQTVAEDATGDTLVLDATHAYWMERRSGGKPGKVLRVPKSGGKPQQVLEHCDPTSIALDSASLYVSAGGCGEFCGPGTVYALSKDGSGKRELSRLDHPLGLLVNGDALYFTAGCGITKLYRVNPSGKEPAQAVGGGGLGEAYRIDGERLYRGSLWTLFVEDMAHGKVLWAIDVEVDSGLKVSITDFAQDGEALFFPTFGGGTVMKWPKRGGMPSVVATLGGRPKRIVADERELFVSDAYVNVIWRITRAGGPPVAMVRESHPPEALAMDDQFVYWLTR